MEAAIDLILILTFWRGLRLTFELLHLSFWQPGRRELLLDCSFSINFFSHVCFAA